MALNDAVPSSAADVFKRNAEDTDRLLNNSGLVVNRLGNSLSSWELITQSHAAWNNRGAWTTATSYAVNDIWQDGINWYVTLSAYTSGVSAAADIAGQNVSALQVSQLQVFADNYQSIRDYSGPEDTLYARGSNSAGDGGESFYQRKTGLAGTYVDNNGSVLVPSGGNGSVGWVSVKESGLEPVTPLMFTDGIDGANSAPQSMIITSDTNVAADITISKSCTFINGAKLIPASGVTVTIDKDGIIYADAEWKDESLGGVFSFSAGSYEERHMPRVTSTTGGRTINNGYPGNSIDESSTTSYVFGGTQSFPHLLGPNSQLSVIGGGYDNFIIDDAIASTIAGGAHHRVAVGSSHSAILGGSYQTSNADYGVLGGGTQNSVACTYGVNVGGQDNRVGDPLNVALDFRSAFNGAGAQNEVYALRSANVGGLSNLIQDTAPEAFNGAGLNNDVSGPNAFNGAGSANTVSGDGAANLAGNGNEASGDQSTTSGSSVKATANYAVALGEFLEANGSGSVATGRRCKADLFGQRAHASGYFAAKGDAQISELVARALTTGSQTKRLDLFGGVSAPILIPDNTTWLYKIYLVGRNIDTDGENGAWVIEGAIKKDGTSASAALVGTPTTSVINAPTDWNPSTYPIVSADISDGSMKIEVSTGVSVTDNIRWVARIELTEVAG